MGVGIEVLKLILSIEEIRKEQLEKDYAEDGGNYKLTTQEQLMHHLEERIRKYEGD